MTMALIFLLGYIQIEMQVFLLPYADSCIWQYCTIYTYGTSVIELWVHPFYQPHKQLYIFLFTRRSSELRTISLECPTLFDQHQYLFINIPSTRNVHVSA